MGICNLTIGLKIGDRGHRIRVADPCLSERIQCLGIIAHHLGNVIPLPFLCRRYLELGVHLADARLNPLPVRAAGGCCGRRRFRRFHWSRRRRLRNDHLPHRPVGGTSCTGGYGYGERSRNHHQARVFIQFSHVFVPLLLVMNPGCVSSKMPPTAPCLYADSFSSAMAHAKDIDITRRLKLNREPQPPAAPLLHGLSSRI
jgi:hypothetical protein